MVSSKKASLYDRITQERINQNWNRAEKLCKDQETKHVLKHTAAKNLQLKEHRHLFFKLLQAEANFEKANCTYDTLGNYSSLLGYALEMGFIKAEELDLLNSWRKDPANWNNI